MFRRIVLIAAALMVLIIPKVSAETYGQVLWVPGEPDSSEFAVEVLELVNIERENAGLEPLELDEDLVRLANIRAEEIVENFSHTRPNGTSCFTILEEVYYHTCGENIAAGSPTPERVVEQWMDSPGHRANILNANYQYLGVGYFYDENSMYKHYWVQLFVG